MLPPMQWDVKRPSLGYHQSENRGLQEGREMVDGIDVQRVRDETPGCSEVIHFNNAGAALMPRPVLDATVGHLQLEAMIGGYEAADRAADKIQATYDATSRLIGAEPDEIAVVENATRAFDMVFYAIPFQPGDRILTAMAEYSSNVISYYQVAAKTGAVVEVVPNDDSGQISVDALRDMIDDRVKLIAISHIPTNGGLVQPVEAVGKVAKDAGVLYLLDACQSVGQLPVDVHAIGCDMLSATSRKFLRGPRGVGFLYVRSDLIEQLEPPFLDNHAATWVDTDRYEIRSDARRFENWESNIAGKIGMGVAAEYALEIGVEAGWHRIQQLAAGLRQRINANSRSRGSRFGRGPVRHRQLHRGRCRPGGDHGAFGRAPHQRYDLNRLLDALRYGLAGYRSVGACIGPLLQHRRGARSLRRGAGIDALRLALLIPLSRANACREFSQRMTA